MRSLIICLLLFSTLASCDCVSFVFCKEVIFTLQCFLSCYQYDVAQAKRETVRIAFYFFSFTKVERVSWRLHRHPNLHAPRVRIKVLVFLNVMAVRKRSVENILMNIEIHLFISQMKLSLNMILYIKRLLSKKKNTMIDII